MSRLLISGRPWVVFDPANADHRSYFREFVATHSWRRCPVRFVLPSDQDNLVNMIQSSLAQYYVEQEFDRE